jgi:hypothetical protein
MMSFFSFLLLVGWIALVHSSTFSFQKVREIMGETSRIRKGGFSKLRSRNDYDNVNDNILGGGQAFFAGTDLWTTMILFLSFKIPSQEQSPRYYENTDFVKQVKLIKIYRWITFISVEVWFIYLALSAM